MTPLPILQSLIEQRITAYREEHPLTSLTESIHYLMAIGGKRMRPALTLMGCEATGGTVQAAMDAALAVEVFHNFTLMHDDIMDAAPLRRGKPTVHTKWNTNTAILSGDAMLIQAYQLLARYPPDKLPRMLTLFNESAFGVCAGQQMDMDFEKRDDVTVEEYIEMIRLKTAVLLGCALDLGACIAGAGDREMHHLRLFGEHLGISFQLRDDYLDAFGDPGQFGKQVGGDILADKKTYLLIRTFEKASPDQRAELQRLSGGRTDPDHKIARVRAIMEDAGADREVLAQCDRYYASAIQNLDAVGLPDERCAPLRELAAQLLHRQS
jgi:geranylgeranyl diphosphate synthase, type II